MLSSNGYAAMRRGEPLRPLSFSRRDPGAHDVVVDIAYCGVCHTDVHHVRNGGVGMFPLVPGHEIVGRVAGCGPSVTRFAVGDPVAVGSICDSCGSCAACQRRLEQYCEKGFTAVYRGSDRDGHRNYGGYAANIVVDEHYALRLCPNVDLARTAPLLCAGVTTYSPLKHWQAGPSRSVGIVGMGGLGHMALKFAKAMGASVTVFTTSTAKIEDAHRLAADQVVLSTDRRAMCASGPFDLIVDTVAAAHNVGAFLDVLRFDGTLVMLGIPEEPIAISPFYLEQKRLSLAGSLVGGIDETQEMLDFCAAHHIGAEVETIAIADINAAHQRLLQNDVKYRFVIDMTSLDDLPGSGDLD
jgi:uncharacterized zinc-type alcohol dehydrogenase-like protein